MDRPGADSVDDHPHRGVPLVRRLAAHLRVGCQKRRLLHLYVGFVTEDMYVYFITTANDPDVFGVYSAMKDAVYTVGVGGKSEW